MNTKYLTIGLLTFTLAGSVLPSVSAEENTDPPTGQTDSITDLSPSEQAEYLIGKKDYAELHTEYSTTGKSVESSSKYNKAYPSAVARPTGSMGNAGDVLITMSGSSSSKVTWVGGHAALVVDGYNTIEAFGNAGTSKDGVRYWTNNFHNRYKDAKGYSVSGTSMSTREKAVSYAESKLCAPYNFNFFNKTNTSAFYCSQIVWKAWKQQGVELDYNGGDAVWPGDLDKSPKLVRTS